MEYNADELHAPSWLNDAFFLKVIREFEKDASIALCHGCKLRPGTKQGEHFASVMYRTTVHYRSAKWKQERALDLIMKTKPTADGLKKDLLADNTIFDKEIRMYSRVLPEMARRLKEIGEDFKYPRFVYGALEPHTIFILEDVSGQGWKTAKLIPTFEESQPVIRALAKFHAASVMIEREDKNFVADNYYNPVEMLKALDTMSDRTYQELIEFLGATEGLTRFAEPLKQFQTTLDSVMGIHDPAKNYMNVMIHGDFHMNNLLHLCASDGTIHDSMMIDYQVCSWTTPAVDLYYLLDLTVEDSVKQQHRDEIIHLYHRIFTDILSRVGYGGKLPSLLDLQIEMLQHGGFELHHYVIMFPFRCIDFTKVSFEDWLLGKLRNPALDSEEYPSVLRKVLPRFLHNGILAAVSP